jgi:predicted NBD/HSP70 family sugar kinase
VLGGGVSNQEGFYTLGVESMRKYLLDSDYDVPIIKAELGDSAGVIGAAML